MFVTTDPEESAMFVSARRNAFAALELKGSLMLEDVGAPIPLLPELLGGIAEIAARHDVRDPGRRARRRRQHPPDHRLRPGATRTSRSGRASRSPR